ncbi:hypothetical protein WKW77_23245 [Variovorax ureilyticus]|uniref:Uncharacterized protein n=1 Tax=Variovorax ureilyticus TaxID=1836198 RepID=A0ABU8VK18_9BURK
MTADDDPRDHGETLRRCPAAVRARSARHHPCDGNDAAPAIDASGTGPADDSPSPARHHKTADRKTADRRPFSKLKFNELRCAYTDRSQKIWDSETPGLGIRLSPGGARKFIVQGHVRGAVVPVTLTLSRACDESSLLDVKVEALKKLQAMEAGIDPREEKHKAAEDDVAKRITLQEIFDLYKLTNQKKRGAKSGPRRASTLGLMQYTLDTYQEGIKGASIASITPRLCAKIFDTITTGGLRAMRERPGWHTPPEPEDRPRHRHYNGIEGAPTTANQVMRTLHTLLEFARNEFRDAKTGLYPILAMAAQAGLAGHYSARSLRSGFVTEAGRRQMPPGEAMKMTGHKNWNVFMGYYRAGDLLCSATARMLEAPER